MSQINPGNVTTSTKAFFTALVASGALLLVEVGLFLLLKQKIERIYEPRTYLPPPEKRSPKLPSGSWQWIPALINARAEDIIDKNGLDAYMFLRYLKILVWIFLVYTILTVAIIIPVDFVGQHGASSSLEKITWTNIVDPRQQKRFTAHVLVCYVLTFVVIYLIHRELSYFVHIRQRFLLSPQHSRLAQARTVLITSVPDTLATEPALREFASFIPGGVERVWFYRDTKALNKLFDEREKRCKMLEKATSDVLRDATKAWKKRTLKRKKAKARNIPNASTGEESLSDDEGLLDHDRPATQKLLDELVPQKKRPHNRTGTLNLLGEKVDTIEWCTAEIAKLNTRIDEARARQEEGKFLGSVFVLCNLQMGAHILAQCVSYHEVLQMYDKFIETNPSDIVWRNLDDDALESRSKVAVSWLLTLGIIVTWSIPVAFAGGLSNIAALCKKVDWLDQVVCHAPSPLPSIIQGLLPPVILSALFAAVPYIFQGLAWYEGFPRHSLISVSLYRRFFLFLVIHGFLVVTLSSGVMQAIEDIIENPTQTIQKLAQKLPGASVFFLTYMVTQGLAGAGSALVQLFPLGGYYFGKWFSGRTPREAYQVTFLMPSADFGTLLPRLSLLATIGFAYSVLNPLINLLAFISFGLYYIAWKFLFLQVMDQPSARETGGQYFPMAASNLFVGLYIEQICLACLFFLKISERDSRFVALTQGILMLLLLAVTVWANMLLNKSFAPLTQYLPMSLATKSLAERFGHGEGNDGPEGDVDLFSKEYMEKIKKKLGKMQDRNLAKLGAKSTSSLGHDSDVTADLESGGGNGSYSARALGDSVDPPGATSNPAQVSETPDASQSGAPATGPVDAAQSNDTSRSENTGDSEESLDKNAFEHPAVYVQQPCIWIPRDPLGLSRVLVESLEKRGVKASDEGAVMDTKGVVVANTAPPGQS